jgi:hypothetical protein
VSRQATKFELVINLCAASGSYEAAFREGLGSMGFVEGRNVAIDYQYTENQNDRLPALASDTRRSKVGAMSRSRSAALRSIMRMSSKRSVISTSGTSKKSSWCRTI